MKAFLASLAVFALLSVGAAYVFENMVTVSATDAYSTESANPRTESSIASRPGFDAEAAREQETERPE